MRSSNKLVKKSDKKIGLKIEQNRTKNWTRKIRRKIRQKLWTLKIAQKIEQNNEEKSYMGHGSSDSGHERSKIRHQTSPSKKIGQ